MYSYLPTVVLASAAIASLYGDDLAAFAALKAATTFSLVLLALWQCRRHWSWTLVTFIAALAFCLLGDIALLESSRFVFGLASFLLAHVLFIGLFLRWDQGQFRLLPAAMVFLLAGLFYVEISAALAAMSYPVSIYTSVIALMLAAAISLALNDATNSAYQIGIGAMLFAVSDGILAYNKFVENLPWADAAVLSSYWLALIFITLGCVQRIKSV